MKYERWMYESNEYHIRSSVNTCALEYKQDQSSIRMLRSMKWKEKGETIIKKIFCPFATFWQFATFAAMKSINSNWFFFRFTLFLAWYWVFSVSCPMEQRFNMITKTDNVQCMYFFFNTRTINGLCCFWI